MSVEASPIVDSSAEVRYVAGPGERNRVAVRVRPAFIGPGLAWTFRDPGAAIAPGTGCTAIDQHAARCLPPELRPDMNTARIDVGDLDDDVSLRARPPDTIPGLVVHGGPGADGLSAGRRRVLVTDNAFVASDLHGGEGDDVLSDSAADGVLEGGPGDDRLLGGDGWDKLVGGGGADALEGGPGGDLLSDGDMDDAPGDAGPGPDVFVGGPGPDEVSYRTRSAGVRVDLAGRAGAGKSAEGDVLSGVEVMTGGRGDDRLAGDGAANRLSGGPGRDRLIGRGGDDTLDAGRGRGSISCGPGRDAVPAVTRAPNVVAPDCELISGSGDIWMYYGPWAFTAYPRAIDHRRLRYQLMCPPDELDGKPAGTAPCSASLRVREASRRKRLLATAAVPPGTWQNRAVNARLTSLGRRLAARRRGVRATATLRLRTDFSKGFEDVLLKWISRLTVPR